MPDLTLSANMDTLLGSANNAAARSNLGLGALATVTPGTGVATALAVNIGSAGAPILFNGAAGTPTSLVGTNITGTAAGLTAGTASAVAVGGITGLGTGVATFLATPSSANLASAVTGETGSGALVFGTSPAFTTNITLANGASPTTSAVAQMAFDTDAWAASRGAVAVHDGTATTWLVGVLASDTPSNGQVPTWNTGGTITWETPSGTANGVTAASAAASSGLLWVSAGADRTATATDTVTTINATNMTVSAVAFSRTLASDDTYHGETITGINAGETITQWDAVYYDFTAGEWMQADANAAGEFPADGIAVASSTDGNALTVLMKGFVRNDAWSWSAGPIYLSGTAGGLTQTAPSTSGDNVQIVGKAITADVAFFHFNPTYVTVA